MKGDTSAKTVARWAALGSLFLVTLTPLLVVNSFFFPFITGKAFYFRIMVEIAVGAWGVLAVLDRAYRPRFSWVGLVVLAFVAWMFIADVFAVNTLKAFWSNFERMEGWVLLVHLLGFFYAASNVLRVERKWRAWFLASLGVSLIVLAHALLQLTGALPIHQGSTRIDASFGNSAYLAIYLLFNTFIAGWLALTEDRAWLKWALLALAAIEALFIFFTETRGTILGLMGGLALAALLTAVTAGARARRLAVAALAVIMVLAGGFYLARDSAFVQHNHILQRIASISVSDGQTRFTIWHMAYEGFLEHPVTGWGQEGFNYVFNKYYDPALYQQEPWFDRAHNAFIDWLVAGGLPAFLLYLALFGTAVVLLWRRSELSRPERVALTAALAGYACHNLFVFDNLYSYVYFFALLALIDAQVSRPFARLEAAPEAEPSLGMTTVVPVATAIVGVAIWFINVSGMMIAADLITAITPNPDISVNLSTFESILAQHPFAAQEVREQLVAFADSIANNASVDPMNKQQVIGLAVMQMKQQVDAYPLDAREHLELAYAYQAGGDITDTLTELEKAQQLSPNKEMIWIQSGIAQWDAGNTAAAQEDFLKAYMLGPQFPDLATYAAAGDYATGNAAQGDAILQKAYGTTTVDSDILAVAYYRTKDWQRLIRLWQLRANTPNASAQTLFGLAAAYYAAGEKAQAIAEVNAIAAKYPDAKAATQQALEQIQAGK